MTGRPTDWERVGRIPSYLPAAYKLIYLFKNYKSMKIEYANIKPFVEALKEGGRLIAIAVVSYLLSTVVVNNFVHTILGNYLPEQILEAIVGAIFIILKVADKYLHLTGKVDGNDLLTGGLTRF